MNLPYSTIVKAIGIKPDERVLKYKKPKLHDPLTARETELWLYLALNGCSFKEVATHFNLSLKTVETHFYAIRIKLGCHTASKLIVEAWKRNLCISVVNEDVRRLVDERNFLLALKEVLHKYKHIHAQ